MRSSSVGLGLALVVAVSAGVPAVAHADRRALTYAYEYMTAPEDQTEIELTTTQTRSTWADGAPETFALRLELEHGVGPRWDVSLFHTFEQASGDLATASALHLSEVRLGSRYRFAERGEWPLDLMITGELARQFGASAYQGELRAVVARDLGLLTVVANAIGTTSFGAEVADPVMHVGWAGGATYEPTPAWKLGAESWGRLDPERTDELEAWAGPALAWIPTPRLWVAATAGFGLNDRSDRFTVRAIVGLVL